MSLRLSCPVFILSLVAATGMAGAATIFDQTRTGAGLAADPDVSFPTVAPVPTGTSLDFGTGSAGDILLSWNLLPAAQRGSLRFTITVDYTPLTTDNDPQFGIVAGGRFMGFFRYDNTNGMGALAGSATATTVSNVTTGSPSVGISSGLGVVNPFTYVFDVENDGAGTTAVSYTEDGTTTVFGIPFTSTAAVIDSDEALSFTMSRASGTSSTFNTAERYRLNSLRVQVAEIAPVPLPAALPLLLAALAGTAVLGARRRRT